MLSIVNKLLSRLPVLSWLNGRKTVISAVLVVLSHTLFAIIDLAVLYPGAPWLVTAQSELGELLVQVAQGLNFVGLGGLAVGVFHKAVKAVEEKKG